MPNPQACIETTLSRGELPFFEEAGIADVFFGPFLDLLLVFEIEGFDDFCRASQDERSRGNDGAAGDEGIGPDDTAGTDDGAIEHTSTHANEDLVFDRAGVKDGGVADRDEFPDVAAEVIG